MTDPWVAMVKQLVPNYDELCSMSSIVPDVYAYIKDSTLTVSMQWPDDAEHMLHEDLSKIDACVEWCVSELSNWDDCTRISWNKWNFARRIDAEKFLTLLNLKWS